MRFFTLTVILTLGISAALAQFSDSFRVEEPVILKGAEAISFLNADPSLLVAFRYGNSVWTQIPLQVDEMASLDILKPYGPAISSFGIGYPSGYNILFYCDPATYIGADPNTLLDADDEIVFMAGDAGSEFNGSTFPAGVLANSGREIMLIDSLDSDTGYVYLFLQNGTLDQAAGSKYVTYNFSLNAGSYPSNFNIISGPNPEQSIAFTGNYEMKFLDRWILDDLKIFKGTSSGMDLLDRQQFFFSPGDCSRTEETFAAGTGCHVSIIDGPVRGIRSCMGANSGPLTQQTISFYRSRVEMKTDLRVHTISSLYDVFDFETTATGMSNKNNLNTTALSINGLPESAITGQLQWEQIDGPHGKLLLSHIVDSDIAWGTEANLVSYWEDNVAASVSDCTGDQLAFGTHGWGIDFANGLNICTEPLLAGCSYNDPNFRSVSYIRNLFFDDHTTGSNAAENFHLKVQYPLSVHVDPLPIAVNCSMQIAYAKQNVSCSGFSNGRISGFVNGGNPPYSYLWSNGETTSQILSLNGGVYTLTISDQSGCEKNASISILEPLQVSVFSFTNNPSPGDINLLVTGGVAPYNYNWSTGASSEDVYNLPNGIYFVQVTDFRGCAQLHSVTLISP